MVRQVQADAASGCWEIHTAKCFTTGAALASASGDRQGSSLRSDGTPRSRKQFAPPLSAVLATAGKVYKNCIAQFRNHEFPNLVNGTRTRSAGFSVEKVAAMPWSVHT